MLKTFIRSACLAVIFNAVVVSLSQAWELTKGDLTIKIYPTNNDVTTGCHFSPNKKAGTYHITGGGSGVLYPTNCSLGDADLTFKFVDVSGGEKCIGRMTIGNFDGYYEGGIYSLWAIDGTVRGSSCSNIGKTFIVKDMN